MAEATLFHIIVDNFHRTFTIDGPDGFNGVRLHLGAGIPVVVAVKQYEPDGALVTAGTDYCCCCRPRRSRAKTGVRSGVSFRLTDARPSARTTRQNLPSWPSPLRNQNLYDTTVRQTCSR